MGLPYDKDPNSLLAQRNQHETDAEEFRRQQLGESAEKQRQGVAALQNIINKARINIDPEVKIGLSGRLRFSRSGMSALQSQDLQKYQDEIRVAMKEFDMDAFPVELVDPSELPN